MKPSQRLAAKLSIGQANRNADEELAWLEEEEAMWDKLEAERRKRWEKAEKLFPMSEEKKSFWERLFGI